MSARRVPGVSLAGSLDAAISMLLLLLLALALGVAPSAGWLLAPLFLALPATLVLPSFDAVNGGFVVAVTALPEPVPRVPIPISFCRFIE